MKSVKLTHYIVESLRDEGADHIFMVPGGYVDNFSQSIVDIDGIKAVVCASEGGAAMMADGYARAARRFGVCLGISGPGATNMITGLSISNADQTPVLAITGDTPLGWRDRNSIQDSGTHGLRSIDLFRQLSSAQYQVYDANLIGDYMRRSISQLKTPCTGFTHLSVPLDLQKKEIEYDYMCTPLVQCTTGKFVDSNALNLALEQISFSTKTVLLVGAGVRRSNASEKAYSLLLNDSVYPLLPL